MYYLLILWALTAAAGGFMYLWQDNQIKDAKLQIQGLIVEVSVAESNLEAAETHSAVQATQIDQYTTKIAQIGTERAAARKQVRELQALFNGHDFNDLLQKKPGLIQNRMQKGTKQVFKEFEDEINTNTSTD